MTDAIRPRRLLTSSAKLLFILALAAGVAAATSPSAQAKPKRKSCAEAIRNDWYGDGQIDKQYEVHCYREAIRGLPLDVKDYQHASEDILRALAYRKKGRDDPGSGASFASVGPTGDDSSSASAHPPGIPPTADPNDDGAESIAGPGDDLGGSSVASVPIPLLVLGGLAVLLLGAGGVGYVSRRTAAGHADDDAL